MSATYELSKTTSDEFMFNLKAGNGEVILTSQRYSAKAHAETGIASVRTNAGSDDQYERKVATSAEPYFVLTAGNHEVIGTSQMYSSPSARDEGIASVKANAKSATISDIA